MQTKTGKFITIEGCEGVGKSTQVELLKKYCVDNNIDALFTREPGGTPIAERIRQIILDTASEGMYGLTELFLFSASRVEHMGKIIMPALYNNKIVFCDRFTDSTLAYQAYARGENETAVKFMNDVARLDITINCTIFLDVDPTEGFKRIASRGQADRMENMGIDFHKKVYEGFLDIAKNSPDRVVSVNGNRSIEEVHNDIIAVLKKRNIL
ncbi:MAG: dTMP kinase [Firmicutes bacterium]|nr:dTMP kinase [Bacillota bacterium]